MFAVFAFKINVSIILKIIQWNYQLTKENWLVCELGTLLLFNGSWFQNLPSDTKSYRAFQETGPGTRCSSLRCSRPTHSSKPFVALYRRFRVSAMLAIHVPPPPYLSPGFNFFSGLSVGPFPFLPILLWTINLEGHQETVKSSLSLV